jgi:hypothetical protein
VVLLLCGCSVVSCAAPARQLSEPPPAGLAAAAFGNGTAELVRYHSRRLALSLPLPDGPSWVVDDRSRAQLVATHAPTHSTVVVALIRTAEVVGREQCEKLARERALVPMAALEPIEDVVAVTQGAFDTRIVVGLEPGQDARAPLTGHVTAFGGFLRKCYVFDFSTRVAAATDEAVLSSRLAFARTRILPGLAFDPIDRGVTRTVSSDAGDLPRR